MNRASTWSQTSRLAILVVAMLVLAGCQGTEGTGAVVPGRAESLASGWLQWRGPGHDGTSAQVGLPQHCRPAGPNHLWDLELPGRGTAVVARYDDGPRLFVWGYRGQGADVREVLLCVDPITGRPFWERRYSDFISDIIYNRYAIGAPAVDAETGNVYLMTTPGLFVCLDRHGTQLWQHSMMESFGRLTFPNGRTGAPAIDGDLVILNCITSNWGRQGPARNRFYAFDKRSGEPVWVSTPGVGPPFLKDSSFCQPHFEWRGERRVFYVGTGCGNIVCVDARTGHPIFRYQMSYGGVNSQPIVVNDHLIAIHGKENIDDTGRGRMVALDLNRAFEQAAIFEVQSSATGPLVLDASYESWRNDQLSMFTSSPVVLNGRIYQVTTSGELFCVDPGTGKTLWRYKLGADQLHASPLAADGKLYVPTWHDGFYIIRPTDDGPQILDQAHLEGDCIGSPSVWEGHLYVHTTQRLYCFGQANPPADLRQENVIDPVKPGMPARRQVFAVPNEVLLRPGTTQSFSFRGLEGNTNRHVSWRKYIPPGAKVKAKLDAEFNDVGHLVVTPEAKISAGAFEASIVPKVKRSNATLDREPDLAYIRARILPSPPYSQDFEGFELAARGASNGERFAYPPLPWIGARLKWQVRDLDGNKVLAKTLDRVLFQRSMVFIGHPDDSNYTIAADVMTDGNRRVKGDIGLVNQRYIIVLRGNNQILEVHSNHDRLKVSVPYRWKPGTWHRLKARVDVAADGTGVIRAKAWPTSQPEPEAWTIEVPHLHAHMQGSPGLFGFSPQSLFPVYVDNIEVTPNR